MEIVVNSGYDWIFLIKISVIVDKYAFVMKNKFHQNRTRNGFYRAKLFFNFWGLKKALANGLQEANKFFGNQWHAFILSHNFLGKCQVHIPFYVQLKMSDLTNFSFRPVLGLFWPVFGFQSDPIISEPPFSEFSGPVQVGWTSYQCHVHFPDFT